MLSSGIFYSHEGKHLGHPESSPIFDTNHDSHMGITANPMCGNMIATSSSWLSSIHPGREAQ
jgi:hypothetical protein